MDDVLKHYGMKYRSGRYPYGSGENPFQHDPKGFMDSYKKAMEEGKTDKDFASENGLTTTQLVVMKRMAKNAIRRDMVAEMRRMSNEGIGATEIGRKFGVNESTVRSLLDPASEYKMNRGEVTAEILKAELAKKGMLDVGKGVEHELGVSRGTLEEAIWILNLETGAIVYNYGVPQVTNKSTQTINTVLVPKGTTLSYVMNHKGDVKSVGDYYIDKETGKARSFQFPTSVDSSRIQVVTKDEGGSKKDGVIELRRGVADLSLGDSHYAQVRIAFDDKYYLKGMAIYSDDLPDGIDIRVNSGSNDLKKPFKPMNTNAAGEIDRDNPFGALIKDRQAGGQYEYVDKDGKTKLGAINIIRSEGDWDNYRDSLSSQFLSKQPVGLIKRQLDLSYSEKENEFNEIMNLTNPVVKKNLLTEFASECDKAAETLQAAALPRQNWQVILPISSLKDNEIYAQNYKNGEKVALVRYPHGGTFEIPILTVNNNQKEAKEVLGKATDAVGINSNVAERLSGADFDGDTVLVIPTNDRIRITSTPQLEGLEGFDPKDKYGTKDSGKVDKNGNSIYVNEAGKRVKILTKSGKQREMGEVSNLITDMTLKGASPDEIARAVRHSMVVIDAEKHKLDYKQSEKDNNIKELKDLYQGHYKEDGNYSTAASTIISSSRSEIDIPETQGTPKVDKKWDPSANDGRGDWVSTGKEEGKLYFKPSNREYIKVQDPITGKEVPGYEKNGVISYKNSDGNYINVTSEKVIRKKATQKSTKMAVTDDARTLSSGTAKEEPYVIYANNLKSLANQARLEKQRIPSTRKNKEAAVKYSEEVSSLERKLVEAKKNAPRERLAQRIANDVIAKKKEEFPEMTAKELGKVSTMEIKKARENVGAKHVTIDITEKEWEAIQAGAITETKLSEILLKADSAKVREYATPKNGKRLSTAQENIIFAYYNNGYTISEIADKLGVSPTTVRNHLKKS